MEREVSTRIEGMIRISDYNVYKVKGTMQGHTLLQSHDQWRTVHR